MLFVTTQVSGRRTRSTTQTGRDDIRDDTVSGRGAAGSARRARSTMQPSRDDTGSGRGAAGSADVSDS